MKNTKIISMIFIVLLLTLIILFLAKSQINAPSSDTITSTATPTQEATEKIYKVYYANYTNTNLTHDSNSNPLDVFPVDRTSNRSDVENMLIEQLLIGPTEAEKLQGYTSDLNLQDNNNQPIKITSTSDASNLFQISKTTNLTIVDFSARPILQGDLSGGRINEQIKQTLTQIPNIGDIEVRFEGKKCWNDLSGLCVE